ncbi:O-methyltransferase [Flavitalea sp. BT771]|uniref:O-methyltransferase n=1 Tax=Flavitalea sp. BT771 TaxID=3063329 RepID=UPI0026E22108|nr:O-methyltransferase [Flavitalea sp. BT771]MDO6435084.1 O-methyltransferase [Flavitalea sp. BT771]MDV6223984.1 O-methyltransferase [Flavitalea sp. BT771]
MDIINPLAQAYAERYSSPEPALLHEIADYTYKHHSQPHMLSGHLQGRLLEMISRIQRPRRILEIGTFMGYSAICLAAGLVEGGQLHTIELREEDADTAAGHFRRANMQDRIILHRGNALEIIPALHEDWDLVFIDADKVNYTEYYKLVLPRLAPGGLIIADNVFFHGEVFEGEVSGKNARAIQAFNEYVEKDGSVEKLMLTIRDGLMFVRKK